MGILTRGEYTVTNLEDGRGISNSEITYQKSTSGIVIPTGSWLTSIPSLNDGEYLWTRTLFTYTDGTTTKVFNVSRNGTAGLGISRTDVHYQKSTSGITAPTGTWTATIPTVAANQYLWTRTTIIYTDASTSVSYSVGKMGADGRDAQLLYLTASSQVQAFDKDNQPKTTQPITISAKLQNASGTATFVAIPYIDNTAQTPITLGGTGNDRTLMPSQWTDPKWTIIAITATLGSLTDTISITKTKDGDSGKTPVVHIAWADSADGSVGFTLELPTNKIPKYRGYYVDYSTVASTDPKKYKWERNPDDAGVVVDKAMAAAESAVANSKEAERLAATASQNATTAKQQASSAQNAANAAQGEISRIDGVITDVKGDINTALQEVAGQAADLQATKETLEASYAKKTEVSDVKAALTTEISKKVGELQTTVSQTYAAKNDVVAMEGRLQSQITQTAGEVSSVVGKVEQLESDTAEAQKKVNEALEKSAAAQATADKAQSNATEADRKVTAAQADLSEAKQNLTATINRVDATEADIAEAQLKVESAQAAVAQAQRDAAEAALAASNAQAAANKAQQDVAALTKRVVSAETAITQNAEQIKLAATKTEEVGNKLDNLKIGGRNLYNQSNNYTFAGDTSNHSDTSKVLDNYGFKSVYNASKAGMSNVRIQNLQFNGITYATVSFDAYVNTGNLDLRVDICDLGTKLYNISTTKTRYSLFVDNINKHNTPDGYNGFVDWLFTLSEEQTFYVEKIMVEHATTPSNYSPAPEIFQGQIDSTNSNLQNNYYSKTQTDSAIKVASDSVTTTVRKEVSTEIANMNNKVDGINDNLTNNYFTKEQTEAAITVKADSITQTVSKTYATKGNTIKSSVEEFYQSTSPTALSGGSWSTTQPTWVQGKYIWRRTKNTYGDDTIAYTPSANGVCITGNSGQNGKGVSSYSITYQVGTSGTTAPTGTWTTTIPTVPQGQYLWTKMVITYTDNTSSTSYSVSYIPVNGQTGATGATGNGVSSITTEFYLSTSKTTQTGGSWSTTQPTWSPGKYVWTRNKITYTNGSTAYTSPQCSSEWEAVNGLQFGGRNILRGTKDMKLGSGNWNNGTWRQSSTGSTKNVALTDFPLSNITQGIEITSDSSACGVTQDHLKLESGEYTLSYYVKAKEPNTTVSIEAFWNAKNVGFYKNVVLKDTNWTRISITCELKESQDTIAAGFIYVKTPNSTITVAAPFEHRSNKEGEWSPAPEDMATAEEMANLTQTVTNQETKIDQTSSRIDLVASSVTEVGDKIDNLKLVGENLILNGYGEFGNNKNFTNYIFDGANSYNNRPSFKTNLKTTLSIGSNRIPIDIDKAYQFSMNIKSDNGGKIYLGWYEYDIDGNRIYPYNVYALSRNTTTILSKDLNDGDTVIYLDSTAGWVSSDKNYQNGLIFWNYRDSTGYLYPEGVYSRNVWFGLYTKENVNKTNNTITLKSPWNYGTIPAGTRVSQSNDGGTYKYRNFLNSIVPTSWTNTSFRIGEDHQLQAPYSYDLERFSPAAKSIAFAAMWSYGTSVVDTYYINSVELKSIDDKLLIDDINNNLSNNYYSKTQTDAAIKVATDSITSTVRTEITTVNNKVDNLQVGGRNYLIGTNKEYKAFDLGQWACILFSRNLSDLNLKVGDYITLACDLKVPSNAIKGGRIRVQFFNSDSDRLNYYGEICNVGEEKRIKLTKYIDSKLLQYKRIDFFINSTNTDITANESGIQSRHEKLEIGNMMTDWSPAPEDLQVQVGGRNYLSKSIKGRANFYESNGKLCLDLSINKDSCIFFKSTIDVTSLEGKTVTFSFDSNMDTSRPFGIMKQSYKQITNIKTGRNSYTFIFPESVASDKYEILFDDNERPIESGILELSNFKLEIGNKATDWSPAPEDMATAEQAQQAQNDANEANSKADSNEHRVSVAESTIKQLSDSISMMVTDSNGSSMMTQTSDGWTFNIGAITDAIDSATNNIDNLSGSLSQTNNVVNNLNNLANDLSKKTAYINMTTDETGAPCIELGKTGNAFKVRITNTSVDFIEGSSKIAYVSNQALFIERAIIKSELQIGEKQGFIWKTRSNGNMGLRWFG